MASSFDLNPEPFHVRWGRRALTISGVFLLSALIAATFPLLAVVALLLDLYRRHAWLSIRSLFFFCGYLFYYCAGIIGCFGAWVLSGGSEERCARLTQRLSVWWAQSLWRVGEVFFGCHTEIADGELAGRGRFILFIRHASLVDTLLGLAYIMGPNRIVLRHVLKSELLWDPCVDIAGHRWQNGFVKRGSGDTAQEVATLLRMMEGLGDDGILIYPEGTRFTPEKREKILASIAKKHPERFQAASALKNLLPPHLGGPLALLERNEREGADALICAHTGLEGTRDLRHFLNGSMLGAAIRVKFWRVPYAEIPREREARIAWLYAWWSRVDTWIGEQRG